MEDHQYTCASFGHFLQKDSYKSTLSWAFNSLFLNLDQICLKVPKSFFIITEFASKASRSFLEKGSIRVEVFYKSLRMSNITKIGYLLPFKVCLWLKVIIPWCKCACSKLINECMRWSKMLKMAN